MAVFDPAYLKSLPVFSEIPAEHLQWLLQTSEIITLQAGELLFDTGQSADYMYVLLEGQLNLSLEQSGRYNFFSSLKQGDVTGYLPFSRLKVAGGRAVAQDHTSVLRLHKRHFGEMEQVSPEMVQKLVALMTDRVREFTRTEQQHEKLIALGKLSAGLAHELNNPAAAIVRSASELRRMHHAVPDKFKRIMTMQLTPEQVDELNAVLFSLMEDGRDNNLPLMERASLEDELIDWLVQKDVEETYSLAGIFAGWNVTVDSLEKVSVILGGKYLPEILDWIANSLETERVICNIQSATRRISELVSAVKTYSHMDKGQGKEKTSIPDGIGSTLTILNHKLKEKDIRVARNYDTGLPLVPAFVGELNQLWTNIIDNAVDAMSEKGTLRIDAWPEPGKVIVRIADDGHGIPKDVLPHIYEPFFSTKQVGKGTGLGLDIVHKIVMHHGASIKVSSEPGNTVFQICFPLD